MGVLRKPPARASARPASGPKTVGGAGRAFGPPRSRFPIQGPVRRSSTGAPSVPRPPTLPPCVGRTTCSRDRRSATVRASPLRRAAWRVPAGTRRIVRRSGPKSRLARSTLTDRRATFPDRTANGAVVPPGVARSPTRLARRSWRLVAGRGSHPPVFRPAQAYLMLPRDSVASRNRAVRHWDYNSATLQGGQGICVVNASTNSSHGYPQTR